MEHNLTSLEDNSFTYRRNGGNSRRRAAAGTLVIGLACVIGLGACSAASSSSRSERPVAGKTITWAVPVDPGNLDPDSSLTNGGTAAEDLAYDHVLFVDASGALRPWVVFKWTATNTSSYELTVRPGITFSDGTPLTATVLADNINYVANPKNASELLGVSVPAGAKATAHDATRTVDIKLPAPNPFFLENLSGLPVVGPKGLANRKYLQSHTDGSGPYILASANPGVSYTYTLRKGYTWGPSGASTSTVGVPAKVILSVVANETTAANELLAGQLNIATVDGPDRQRLEQQKLFRTTSTTGLGKMLFNQISGPMADFAVRKALVTALDFPKIAAVTNGGLTSIPTGLFTNPKVCPGNTLAGSLPKFDLARAKAILSSDGWTVGSGGIRSKGGHRLALTVIYISNGPLGPGAELIAQEWKALGVSVNLAGSTEADLDSTLFDNGNWNVALLGLILPNPDALSAFLTGPIPPKGTNFAHLHNAAYDSLINAATKLTGQAGCADWNKAEKSLYANLDVIPYADVPTLIFGKNATFNVVGNHEIVPTSIRALG